MGNCVSAKKHQDAVMLVWWKTYELRLLIRKCCLALRVEEWDETQYPEQDHWNPYRCFFISKNEHDNIMNEMDHWWKIHKDIYEKLANEIKERAPVVGDISDDYDGSGWDKNLIHGESVFQMQCGAVHAGAVGIKNVSKMWREHWLFGDQCYDLRQCQCEFVFS